jgi:hypothetical protein
VFQVRGRGDALPIGLARAVFKALDHGCTYHNEMISNEEKSQACYWHV